MKKELEIVMCVLILLANALGLGLVAVSNERQTNVEETPQSLKTDFAPSADETNRGDAEIHGNPAPERHGSPTPVPLQALGGSSAWREREHRSRGLGIAPTSGNYYTFYDDKEHYKTCREAQYGDPYLCTDPTDTFYNTDSKVLVWLEINDVYEEVRFLFKWYSPGSSFVWTLGPSDWTIDPKDYGYQKWGWWRFHWGYYLAGTVMADYAGQWHVELYVEEAHEGTWQYEATRWFTIIDNTAPSVPPGTPTDQGEWSSSSSLLFSWSPAYDSNGVGAHQLKIALAPGSNAVFDGEVGTVTSYVYPQGQNGNTYYASVRARNREDDFTTWSGWSDGIRVDLVPPSAQQILIGGGSMYTSTRSVSLSLYSEDPGGSGVSQMRLRNEGLSGSWEPYQTSRFWTLPAEEGQHTVYLATRDRAGNEADEVTDSIILDSRAPFVSLSINNNDPATNTRDVVLTISATDPSPGAGVTIMCFSTDGSPYSGWEPFGTTRNFQLPAGDGNHTISIRVRDAAGNEGGASDEIELDTVGPTPTLVIEGGANYTNDRTVLLEISTDEQASEVSFRNEGEAWSPWEDYVQLKSWSLSPGDGQKRVYVQIRDVVGNIGQASAVIMLDATPPSIDLFQIEGGKPFTRNANVVLTIIATDDGSGLATTAFREAGQLWTTPEPFNTSREWLLSSGDGEKTLYVRVSDLAGNEVTETSKIAVDTTPPSLRLTIDSGAAYTNTTRVTLSVDATDPAPGSGADSMTFSNDGFSWSSFEPVGASRVWTLGGGDASKRVWARVLDAVGNVAEAADDIVLDQTAPTVLLNINGGALFTNSREVELNLVVADANGVEAQSFRTEGSPYGPWEPIVSPRTWQLGSTDRSWEVFGRVRDLAGNIAETSARILLDTTSPQELFIVINDGAPSTVSPDVTLTLGATDPSPGSGVAEMSLWNGIGQWSAWHPFETALNWTLDSNPGVKTVSFRVRDAANNVANEVSDSISLASPDTTPPTVSLNINGGTLFTNSRDVTLNFLASDENDVEAQSFRNEGSPYEPWEPVVTPRAWSLGSTDGPWRVFGRARDFAGNIAETSAQISLDTTAPRELSIVIDSGAPSTTTPDVVIVLGAVDPVPGSGVAEMSLRNGNGQWSPWQPFEVVVNWTLDSNPGVKVVYFRVRDAAGNMAMEVSDSISLANPNDGGDEDWTIRVTPVLMADRSEINVSEVVTFTAFLEEGEAFHQYVDAYFFDFDDGTTSDWITSRTIPHQYASAGLFVAKLRIRDDQGRVTNAAILSIYVHDQAEIPTAGSDVVDLPELLIIVALAILTVLLLLVMLWDKKRRGLAPNELDGDSSPEQQDDTHTLESQEQPITDEDDKAVESKLRELLTVL